MPAETPANAGYSFTASGGHGGDKAVGVVTAALNKVLDDPASGCTKRSVTSNAEGWQAEVSGLLESPADQVSLLQRLLAVIKDAAALCGHSSFASAHITAHNPHLSAGYDASAPAVAPVAAGG